MSDAILEAMTAITIIIVSVTCPSLDVSNPLWALGKEISMKMAMAAVAGLNNGEWGDSAQGYWPFGGRCCRGGVCYLLIEGSEKNIKAVLDRGLFLTWGELPPKSDCWSVGWRR